MRFPALFALIGLCLLPAALAQRDSTTLNADLILQEVDQLEKKQKESYRAEKAHAIATLTRAAESSSAANNLYEEAIEQIQFNGQKGKTQAFLEWRKKNMDMLHSREMETALRLHLRYLILSLQRADSEKAGDFVNPSLEYAMDVQKWLLDQARGNFNLPLEVKSLLDRSITESVFCKSMFLIALLPKSKNWELTPGNFEGLLDKNVRPFLREEKSPQLIETWDLQMKFQAERTTLGRLEFSAETYNTVTQPRLLLSRANDMILIGQKNQGCTEILKLLRTYPQHPDFSQWVTRIREILKPQTPDSLPAGETPAPQTFIPHSFHSSPASAIHSVLAFSKASPTPASLRLISIASEELSNVPGASI